MSTAKVLISNVTLFRQMAEEAAAKSLQSLNLHRTLKPNGEPGFIMRADPDRVSMKQGLIAIAFAGMYLEALIRISTRKARDKGLRFVSKANEKKRYGGKLEAVGLKDQALIDESDHFNAVRDDLIHEEPYELSTEPNAVNHLPHFEIFVAQDEAQKAVALIGRVAAKLGAIYGEKKT
jgi:hypothetical protein